MTINATFSIENNDLILKMPSGETTLFAEQASEDSIAMHAAAYAKLPHIDSVILPDGSTYVAPEPEEPAAE